jgi:hypothetical protein
VLVVCRVVLWCLDDGWLAAPYKPCSDHEHTPTHTYTSFGRWLTRTLTRPPSPRFFLRVDANDDGSITFAQLRSLVSLALGAAPDRAGFLAFLEICMHIQDPTLRLRDVDLQEVRYVMLCCAVPCCVVLCCAVPC